MSPRPTRRSDPMLAPVTGSVPLPAGMVDVGAVRGKTPVGVGDVSPAVGRGPGEVVSFGLGIGTTVPVGDGSGVTVSVGVGVGVDAQDQRVMLFVSMVTAPMRARARPRILAPVARLIDSS